MTRRIADIFQEAAERQVKAHSAGLVTGTDWQNFLEAARGLLTLDSDLKSLMGDKKRYRLRNSSIASPAERDDYQRELLLGIRRVANGSLLDDLAAGDRIAGIRIAMAALIAGGFPVQDREALKDATIALCLLRLEGEHLERKRHGATRRNSRKAADATERQRVQKLATEWRKSHPNAKRADFYRWLLELNRKKRSHTWSDIGTIRNWIGRKGIEV